MSQIFAICNSYLTREIVGELQIFTASCLFGLSFVFQRYAMVNANPIEPFTFNFCRYGISTIFLYLVKPWLKSVVHSEKNVPVFELGLSEEEKMLRSAKELWFWAFIGAFTMFVGSSCQQLGLVTVPAAKAGFMCGAFVILVPILVWMIPNLSKKPCKWTWISASMSLFGLYLLSGCDGDDSCVGGSFSLGEIYIFIGTFFWAANIITIDIAANRVDAVDLTAAFFLLATLMVMVLSLLFERDSYSYPFSSIRNNLGVLLFTGLVTAIATVIATLGQMYCLPSRASLIFSLESVVCAILSLIILREALDISEVYGCGIMFGAVILFAYMTGKQVEDENAVIEKVESLFENRVETLYSAVVRKPLSRGNSFPKRTRGYSMTEYLAIDSINCAVPENSLPRPHSAMG